MTIITMVISKKNSYIGSFSKTEKEANEKSKYHGMNIGVGFESPEVPVLFEK